MNPLILKAFRVRRAAREPGHADTLHELEWLGGEALVAPLPHYAGRVDASQPPCRALHAEDVCIDWVVM